MSTLHDTADAVTTLLNAGVTASAFTLSFAAETAYDAELLIEDMAEEVSVLVVPATLECAANSRVSVEYLVGIDVAVRQRLGQEHHDDDAKLKVADVGIYLGALEEVMQYLAKPANRALAAKLTARWVRNEIRFPWIPEHLRNHRQYTGIFRATYAVAVEP